MGTICFLQQLTQRREQVRVYSQNRGPNRAIPVRMLLGREDTLYKMTVLCSVDERNAHDVVHWGNAPKWYTASCSP